MTFNQIKKAGMFLLACLLMTLIYTQLPLYTSNQHQYFLHGMARAGLGSLDEDWLASTREPAPLFSLLVQSVFTYLRSPIWFYIFYALLMGLYLLALLGITQRVLGVRSRAQLLLSATLILLAHSAALRALLGSALGANWNYLLDGGLAGQRLLGPVLQPSAFGVLLLAALYLFLIAKPYWACALAALAACIHPTYLLSAALLVVGFMLQDWLEQRDWLHALGMGALALAVVAPILIYTLVHFYGGEEREYAQYILSEIRLPHHTQASQWMDLPAVFKIAMVGVSLYLLRCERRLATPMALMFIGALVLSAYQVASADEFLALLFPWRPSVLLVPLSSGILIAKGVVWVSARVDLEKQSARVWIEKGCLGLLLLLSALGVARMSAATVAEQRSPQRSMLEWVRGNSVDGDRYLVPVNLERFRTYTLRPIYVDFYAIPYGSKDVVTWYHRVLAANKFYDSGDCGELYHVSYDGGLNHVVIEASMPQLNCPGLEVLYQDSDYIVYRYDQP